MATPEQITIANKTSRNSPAIGMKAITPKYVRLYLGGEENRKELSILDFGSGKTANHARALVEDGYQCLAHEFGDNVDPRYHCELALMNDYDIVYASNVLNVQSTENMLRETLIQIRAVMKPNGVFFANYPLSPRKSGMDKDEVFSIMHDYFDSVIWIGGTKQAPVWIISNDKN